MTSVFIMAAGESTRFGGAVKALLEIGGEVLIDRTVRQCNEKGVAAYVVTKKSIPVMASPNWTFVPYDNSSWVASVWSTLKLRSLYNFRGKWAGRQIILQGDVWYSDECMDKIFSATEPLVYFRNGGVQHWETFAVSFDQTMAEEYAKRLAAFREIVRRDPRRCRFYQYLVKNKVPLKTVIIRDKTQDFDTPEQVEAWHTGQFKFQKLK